MLTYHLYTLSKPCHPQMIVVISGAKIIHNCQIEKLRAVFFAIILKIVQNALILCYENYKINDDSRGLDGSFVGMLRRCSD